MVFFVVLDDVSIQHLQEKMREYGLAELASEQTDDGQWGVFMSHDLVFDALSFLGRFETSRGLLPGYQNIVRINTMQRPSAVPPEVCFCGWSSLELDEGGSALADLARVVNDNQIQQVLIERGDVTGSSLERSIERFIVHFGEPGSVKEAAEQGGWLPFEFSSGVTTAFVESDRCLRFLGAPEVFDESMAADVFRCVSKMLGELSEMGSDAYFAKLERLHTERATDELVSRLWSGLEVEIETMKSELERKHTEYDEALQRLAECRSNLAQAEAKLQAQMGAPDEQKAAVSSELYAVRRIPKVIDVVINKGVISVFTDHLVAFDSRTGRYHAIGKFRIDFFPEETEDEKVARWHNFTRSLDLGGTKFIAPHIPEVAKPCYGKFAQSLPKAIREYRLYSAVTLAISLVERVNVDDRWGDRVNQFPRATVDIIDGVAYFRELW